MALEWYELTALTGAKEFLVTSVKLKETNIEIKSGLKEGQVVVVSMEQTSASAAKKAATTTQSSPFMPKRPGNTKK